MIEVALSIALAAIILVASSALLISIINLWKGDDKLAGFEDHVFGVSEFLKKHIREGYYVVDDDLPKPQWQWIPGSSSATEDPKIAFLVNTPHPAFEGYPHGGLIQCYLSFDEKKGLSIVYHSYLKTEKSVTVREPIYTLELSRWAKKAVFHQYLNQKWTVTEEPNVDPNSKKKDLPTILEIQFLKKGEENQIAFIPLYPESKAQIPVL